MNIKRIALILLLLWLATFSGSFFVPRWVEPTGDGFTRGLNRIGIWLAWQFAASLLAIVCTYIAVKYFRGNKRWKRGFLVPIFGQVSLILLIIGVVVYTYFNKPLPVHTPNTKPSSAAMDLPVSPEPPQAAIEVFTGFYRNAFEQSHFYSTEGTLPFWLIAGDSEWDRLESFLIERPGRGSSITVALEVSAWVDPETKDIDHLGKFRGKLHLVSINKIRPISAEEFELVVAQIGPKD